VTGGRGAAQRRPSRSSTAVDVISWVPRRRLRSPRPQHRMPLLTSPPVPPDGRARPPGPTPSSAPAPTGPLGSLASLVRHVLPGAAEVSITVVDRGQASTVASTGARAAVLDAVQYAAGSGPCLHAAASGSVVAVVDTATDVVHPALSRAAHRRGITHVLSIGLPLQRHGQRTTSVNVYGIGGFPTGARTRELVAPLARHAAVLVAVATAHAQALERSRHLERALESRGAIDQAKGIMMQRDRLTADEAFARLSALSQDSNRKLRDIAADIVAGAADQQRRPAHGEWLGSPPAALSVATSLVSTSQGLIADLDRVEAQLAATLDRRAEFLASRGRDVDADRLRAQALRVQHRGQARADTGRARPEPRQL
jgi:ANTAR domain